MTWRGLSLGLGLLLLPVFLWARYLPMVDLPQHAALIGTWLRLADPSSVDAELFTLNWRTPYLTAYALGRLLAPWVGVIASVNVVVWLCCFGFQLAFGLLVHELRYPAWLSLLGVPLSLGYSYYFGFLSFLAGLPFALLSLWAALVFAREPSARRGYAVGALLFATLLTHGFAAGIALLITTPVLMSAQRPWFQKLWPPLVPLALGSAWLLPGREARGIGLTIWEPRLDALLELPAMLVALSSADHLATASGLALLALVAWTLGRPAKNPWRWLPVSLVLLAFCLFPVVFAGFAPVFPRFAVFVVPTLLVAFEPRQNLVQRPIGAFRIFGAPVVLRSGPQPRTGARAPKILGTHWPGRSTLTAPDVLHPGTEFRAAVLGALSPSKGAVPAMALVACILATFGARLRDFDEETASFAAVVERLPPGLSMRPIVFERESRAFPGVPALLHLSGYYAAEKGGFQGYSFAMYATSPVRYTAAATPGMLLGAEWRPEDFSIDEELPLYESFLVHSRWDRHHQLFGGAERNLDLAFAAGSWRAYRVDPAHASHQALP